MQIESVSLLEVIAAARARLASLAPESSGHVILGLGRAMAGVPIRLDLEGILLTTEGAVSIGGPKEAVSNAQAVAALRKLMVELLDLSNGSSPALRSIAERAQAETSIDAFFGAIANALIPLNRAAAKRALGRLARETLKAYQTGTLERPSLVLDASRGSAISRSSVPSKVRKASRASTPARARLSESPTPIPGSHSMSLTPTFIDTDVSEQHGKMSFREEVMRAVIGYVGKEARPSDVGALPSVTPAEPVVVEKAPPACTALDLLAKPREATELSHAEAAAPVGRASYAGKRLSRRPEKILGRLDDLAVPYVPATVESLLDGFDTGADSCASLKLAEQSLGELGQMHMSPAPAPVSCSDFAATSAGDESDLSGRVALAIGTPAPTPSVLIDVELSPAPELSRASATPAGQALDRGVSSMPPLFLDRMPQKPRRMVLAAGVVTLLGASLAAVAVLRPELIGRAPRAAAHVAVCSAELTLKNLPETHEVLLRLGTAPFTTSVLPRGVRLEVVATAPDHEPRRLVIEPDADWQGDGAGLRLHTELTSGGLRTWPAAPPGEVGGVGPAGQLNVTSSPAGAELWLVLAAGEGRRARVALPCQSTAHLLVVDPAAAAHAKRVDLEPELLKAAAESGDGEVLVQP